VSTVVKAKINFLNFSVRESHIVFKEPGKYKINVGFTPKGFIFPKINQYHIILEIRVKDEDDKFQINIITESIFDYDINESIDKLIDGEFTFNAPAIIFPYVRAYISSLTALSGMPTLVLPTLNLSGIGAELKKSIQIVSE
jgi:preprotein translocase subunit SecB